MTTNTQDALRVAALWLHAAYDRPPQSPEIVSMLKLVDAALSAAPASEQPAPNQGMAFPALSWQQLAKDARARIMIEQGTGHEMLCFNVGAFQQIVDQLSKRAPASNQPMTDEQIIDAVDRPGFAWDNLNSAEQRNLLGTIRALLAQQAADSSEPDWRRFALAVLIDARDNLGSDVDGGMIQDVATECGLLNAKAVTEMCSDECRCSEHRFPTMCYCYSPGVLAAIAAQSQPEGGDK